MEQGATVPLPAFLSGAGNLNLNQRKLLVDQAILLLEQNYVHLPLKAAMHAVNPLQRLRVMRARMERQTPQTMEAEWLFHRQMSSIFHSVRDLHTNYLLPAPFAGKVAFLPFSIEKCFEGDDEHYIVTRVVVGFSAPQFGPGVEVTHWNGTPIARAVALNGAQFAGSNEAANLARGLESLTLRPLVIQSPPDEDWVTVTYVGLDGSERELREQWKVTDNLPPMTDLDAVNTTAASMGLDLDSDEKARAKKLLFLPEVIDLEQRPELGRARRTGGSARRGPTHDHARCVPGTRGRHGARNVRAPAHLHLQRGTTRWRSGTSSPGWPRLCRRTG